MGWRDRIVIEQSPYADLADKALDALNQFELTKLSLDREDRLRKENREIELEDRKDARAHEALMTKQNREYEQTIYDRERKDVKADKDFEIRLADIANIQKNAPLLDLKYSTEELVNDPMLHKQALDRYADYVRVISKSTKHDPSGGIISPYASEEIVGLSELDVTPLAKTSEDLEVVDRWLNGDDDIFKDGILNSASLSSEEIDELTFLGILDANEIEEGEDFQDELKGKVGERWEWWKSAYVDTDQFYSSKEYNDLIKENLREKSEISQVYQSIPEYQRAEKRLASHENNLLTIIPTNDSGEYLLGGNAYDLDELAETVPKSYAAMTMNLSDLATVWSEHSDALKEEHPGIWNQLNSLVNDYKLRGYYESTVDYGILDTMGESASANAVLDIMDDIQSEFKTLINNLGFATDPNEIAELQRQIAATHVKFQQQYPKFPVEDIYTKMLGNYAELWEDPHAR